MNFSKINVAIIGLLLISGQTILCMEDVEEATEPATSEIAIALAAADRVGVIHRFLSPNTEIRRLETGQKDEPEKSDNEASQPEPQTQPWRETIPLENGDFIILSATGVSIEFFGSRKQPTPQKQDEA